MNSINVYWSYRIHLKKEDAMSKETVQEILGKAAKDKAFRELLTKEPDKALKDYEGKLTSEELSSLKAITPEVLEGFAGVLETEKPKSPWKPTSFKEAGGALLTIVLLVLVLWSAWNTFSLVSVVPTTYEVGEGDNPVIKEIDTFQRAKDLLNVFFPIVSALTTFWLGTAVGAQQAEQSQEQADQARQGEQAANQNRMTSLAFTNQALGAMMTRSSGEIQTMNAQAGDSDQMVIDLLKKAASP